MHKQHIAIYMWDSFFNMSFGQVKFANKWIKKKKKPWIFWVFWILAWWIKFVDVY